jgi:hypothetical protein
MADITSSVEIAAAPETVFAFGSDLRNEPSWNPEALAIMMLTDGPVRLGTRYSARWKGSPQVEVECVAFEAGRSWTYHNGGALEVTSSFRVEPRAAGSVLHATFSVVGHGAGQLFAPLFTRRMRVKIPQNMARVRECVESAARV